MKNVVLALFLVTVSLVASAQQNDPAVQQALDNTLMQLIVRPSVSENDPKKGTYDIKRIASLLEKGAQIPTGTIKAQDNRIIDTYVVMVPVLRSSERTNPEELFDLLMTYKPEIKPVVGFHQQLILFQAVAMGATAPMIERLLKIPGVIETVNTLDGHPEYPVTPMEMAVSSETLDVVKMLVAVGGKVDVTEPKVNMNILHTAATARHNPEVWNYVVSVLGNERTKELMAEKDWQGRTPAEEIADEVVNKGDMALLKAMKPYLPKNFGRSKVVQEKLRSCVGAEACNLWTQIAHGNF